MRPQYVIEDPAINKSKLNKCKELVTGKVTGIIDGDTYWIELNGQPAVKVRPIGVDAYEKDTNEGKKATQWATNNLKDKTITFLQQDSNKDGTMAEQDKYGRPLGVVYVDGKNINSELIKSGNGFASVRSHDQISNNSYLTELTDKNRRKDFAKEKEDYKAQIARTGKIVEQMEGAEDALKVPGACKIGTVILPVPPDQITVTEQNVNMPINTVRTAGTPKIKTGQQNIRIELTIFFPSLHDINNDTRGFRRLLAEFLRSPFLPIENQHIRSIIIPDVMWSKPQKLTESQGKFSSATYEREVDKNQGTGHFLRTDEGFQDNVSTVYGEKIKIIDEKREKSQNDIKNIENKIVELNKLIKIEKSNHALKKLESDKIKLIDDKVLLRKDVNKLIKEKSDVSKVGIASDIMDDYKQVDIYKDIQLACALQSIVVSTVPGFLESLQCNLVLDVFNYTPYSYDFSFCKTNKGALKQVEFYNQIINLQYPEMAKEVKKGLYASDQNIVSTKNLSESLPFNNYVTPLLTGEKFDKKETINMNLKIPKKVDGVNSGIASVDTGFTFMAPSNWLRTVSTDEFKRFKCRYDITEVGIQEQESLRMDVMELSSGIKLELKKLVDDIKWGLPEKVGAQLSFMFTKIKEIMGLYFLGQQSTLYGKLVDKIVAGIKNKEGILMTIDIPDPDGGVLFEKGVWYGLETFIKKFKTIKGGQSSGQMIIDLMNLEIKQLKKLRYGFTNRYKFEFTEDEDTVIAGMSASLETRMATLPVLNYTMPTKQYMGRSDWVIQMNLQTCNESLLRILRSLSEKACVSRMIRERSNKSQFIARSNSLEIPPDVDYNGFFKLLGINHILFQDFVYETIKEKPGWWNITMRLVQSDVDLTEYERLVPTNFIDDNLYDEVKEKLLKNYKFPCPKGKEDSYLYSTVYPNIRNTLMRFFLYINSDGLFDLPEERLTKPIAHYAPYNEDDAIDNVIKGGITRDILIKEIKALYFDPLNGKSGIFPVMAYKGQRNISRVNVKHADRILKKRASRLAGEIQVVTKNLEITMSIIGGIIGHFVIPIPYVGKVAGATLGFGAAKGVKALLRWIGGNIEKSSENLMYIILNTMMRTHIIKAILYAKHELINFEEFDVDAEKFQPKYPLYMKGESTTNLYSNYMDLELPEYAAGFLSTPADFFYVKSESQKDDALETLQDRLDKDIAVTAEMGDVFYLVEGLKIADGYNKDELNNNYIGKGFEWDPKKNLVGKILETDADVKKKQDITMKKVDEILKHKKQWKKRTYVEQYDYLKLRYAEAEQSEILMKNIQMFGYCAKIGALHKELKQLEGKIAVKTELGEKYPQWNKTKASLSKMMHEIEALESISKGDQQRWGLQTVWGNIQKARLLHKCTHYINHYRAKDKTIHMGRAYPAIKLYFIEEDAKEWGRVDDYYAYNAIESIEVISNKNTPGDVATISVSNITGNLSDPYSVLRGENFTKEQSLEEQMVLTVLLKEGTTIMIKMGYDNNPLFLDTVFIGKIVSVQLGDRVTMVAQSFGAELHEKCFDGGAFKVGYWRAGQTMGDVVVYAIQTLNGLDHFGSPNILEKLGLVASSKEPCNTHPRNRLFDILRSIHPIVDIYYKFGVCDPRLENIYLPFTNNTFGGLIASIHEFWKTIRDSGKKNKKAKSFKDNTFDWVVQNQSLWEMLNEISLYRKDYITAILPYNHNIPGLTRQTIYLGPRDGYYKYTDLYDKPKKEEEWKKEREKNRNKQLAYKSFFNDTGGYESVKWHFEKFEEVIKKYKGHIEQRKKMVEFGVKINKILNGTLFVPPKCKKYLEEAGISMIPGLFSKGVQIFSDNIIFHHGNVEYKLELPGHSFTPKFFDRGKFLAEINRVRSELVAIKGLEAGAETKEKRRAGAEGIGLSINNPKDIEEKDEKGNISCKKGYMPIRNYYYVDSIRHIIGNDIRASSEEMFNHVKIQYPRDPSKSQTAANSYTHEFFADDNIKGSHLKTYISHQNNIDPSSLGWLGGVKLLEYIEKVSGGTVPTVYQVGYNVLANMMRPMYRGTLTLVGMPSIRTNDILFIRDLYNDMSGPIEIEQVVHRFSQDGFTTTITPNAVVFAQDPGMKYEMQAMSGFAFPIGKGKSVDLRSVTKRLLFSGLGLSIGTGLMHWSISTFMGRDVIDVVGLTYKNQPYVAGLEGMYRDKFRVHMADKIMGLFDFTSTLSSLSGQMVSGSPTPEQVRR